jgi:predicted DCC family thiol-disulfide oxidoreductase YuxK
MCLKNADLPRLTLFFDGKCPLCQAEIVFLSRRNQAGLPAFVDINSNVRSPLAIRPRNLRRSLLGSAINGVPWQSPTTSS